MRVLVVLPTYDEAENIDEILRRLRESVPDAHVLVVDDGSPDGTAGKAEAAAEQWGGIEVLRRARKSGLGSAYRTGFRIGLARGFDVFVEMDADLSHDPAALPSLLAPIADDLDLVIGSRYVPGGSIPHWPWYRRAISELGNLYARTVLAIPIRDATAGYRVYTRRALELVDLSTVRADGYGFQVEMTYRLLQRGGRVLEVPIAFHDRVEGSSKMSWRIVAEAFALVTWWGVRDRVLARRGGARRRVSRRARGVVHA